MESGSIRTVNLYANYFNLKIKDLIFKYRIDSIPQIPVNQWKILIGVLGKVKKELNEKLIIFKTVNSVIYSISNLTEDLSFNNVEYDNINYKITITQISALSLNNLNEDQEAKNFLGRLITNLQDRLKLKRIRSRSFVDTKPIDIPQWKLKIWPGYFVALGVFGGQPVLNIDPAFKIIQDRTILDLMMESRNRFPDYRERLKEELVGMNIMTKYNNMIYKIYDIDYKENPKSKFFDNTGKQMSFIEYYETKYGKKLSNLDQPLIVHKNEKEKKDIFLIPELCVVTGLSNEMRSNFNLMKDLSKTTKPDPSKRLNDASQLVKLMLKEPETKEQMKKWTMSIESDPIKLIGEKLGAGNLLMKSNSEISLENNPDLDRKTQVPMYSQPYISKWGVFYPSRSEELCTIFVENFREATKTYQYEIDPPRKFPIDGTHFNDWKTTFERYLNESVQAIVLLLAGPKKQAPLYNDIKHYFLTKCAIPSQVVLLKTIEAGKNIRSICNKILMQICAKVGGQPWVIDNLPFTDEPSMVIGLDIFNKKSNDITRHAIFAFCATTDRKFSRYWSTVREEQYKSEIKSPSIADIGAKLIEVVKEAIIEFKKTNRDFAPINIIVFRDGISASERRFIKNIEVNAFKIAFDQLFEKKEIKIRPNLIFICTNKPAGAKFFSGDNLMKPDVGLRNPEPGTIIDQKITEGRDFYLISQKTTQGTATPTHYYVLCNYKNIDGKYDDIPLDRNLLRNLEILCYKLCYLYYNWTGSVKIPAPVRYARKLATLIGDRWKSARPMIPSDHFQKTRSLFFI